MLKVRTPLLVGLLVVVGAFAFVFTFGSLDKGADLEHGYSVHAVFDDATGLVLKSRVMLSGIPVGTIEQIALDTDNPSKARITMTIAGDVVLYEGIEDEATGLWKHGAMAMRLQASLLGDHYIGITPGIAGRTIPSGGQIRNTITEAGLGAVIDQLESSSQDIFPKLDKIVTDIAAITGSLKETFGDQDGTNTVREIRDNLHRTTTELAGMSTEFRAFVNDRVIGQGGQVDRIITNVESLTQTLKNTSNRASDRVDGILDHVDGMTVQLKNFVEDQTHAGDKPGTVAHTLHGVDRSVDKLEGTLENTRSITSRIDSGEGTIGRLVTDDALINSVEQVVDDISDFAGSINRLRVNVELRSEYLYRQSTVKNHINLTLQPRPDKFYFFQVVADPKGQSSRTQTITTSSDSSAPPTVVDETVHRDDAIKLTAQFGKRWHFLSFRYGIMESSGGVGIDVELLEDALRFKVDAFDFGSDEWPRLRVLATYEFIRYLYVAAGLDDVLNADNFDYFFGLGVNFDDEDLKGLMPFMPSP